MSDLRNRKEVPEQPDERLLPSGMEAKPERRCICGKFVYRGVRVDGPRQGEYHGQVACVEWTYVR